jgi:hypothetical protein
MFHEITSVILGHALLGAVLAILAFAFAFWLAFAFRSARSAIQELSRFNRALQTSPMPGGEARAS